MIGRGVLEVEEGVACGMKKSLSEHWVAIRDGECADLSSFFRREAFREPVKESSLEEAVGIARTKSINE